MEHRTSAEWQAQADKAFASMQRAYQIHGPDEAGRFFDAYSACRIAATCVEEPRVLHADDAERAAQQTLARL